MALSYKIVDDSERNNQNNDPAVKDLLAGKTLSIVDFPKSSTFYSIAKRNGMKLRTRHVKDTTATIVWMESLPEIEVTPIEAEKVKA